MDGRTALSPGTVLKLSTATGYTLYTVNKEIGRGGSCIVYDASYTDQLSNHKLVRVKECYPYALQIVRDENGALLPTARDAAAFQAAKERMIAAYQRNHELFSLDGLTNRVANTADLYEANGTVYIVSVYLNGHTFRDDHGETLHDCLSLVLGAAKALARIHEAGYLYLDLKPDNILTVEGTRDLVQLFDFDSMISMEELANAVQSNGPCALRTSYTKGYAPLEQQTGKIRQLGRHTDLYSLGAVLFDTLWGSTPTAFDCEPDAAFDYTTIVYPYRRYQDRLFRALTVFLHKTLASYPGDRYQNADEAIAQLQELLALSDETKPWVRSSSIPKSPFFHGRESELRELAQFLAENERHVVSLYGMGGIGKSTLVRQYLSAHAGDWDAVLWLYDRENLADALADDTQVQINTLSRAREETAQEYVQRKLRALGLLANTKRILMVIDNFTAAHIDQLQDISQVGMTVLLISRERLPEGLYPSMQLAEMNDDELAGMFAAYAHYDLTRKENARSVHTILTAIGRHTLLAELIARQVARSYLDIRVAETMVAEMGLAVLPEEKIDYIRDQTAYHGTLLKILDKLVEIDRFTAQDRRCMKLLSLFDMPGVEADLFREMASLNSLDFVNDLETAGWLKSEQRRLYLHPMMQEYVRTWSWEASMKQAAEQMMRAL